MFSRPATAGLLPDCCCCCCFCVQLAVLGVGCLGAQVSVWWPLDEAWYPGVVRAGQGLGVGLWV